MCNQRSVFWEPACGHNVADLPEFCEANCETCQHAPLMGPNDFPCNCGSGESWIHCASHDPFCG